MTVMNPISPADPIRVVDLAERRESRRMQDHTDRPDVRWPLLGEVEAVTAQRSSLPATTVSSRAADPAARALRTAFDVLVLTLAVCAFCCLVLWMLAASSMRDGTGFVAGVAAFGAFTVGAGSVHTLHRMFGRKG